MSLFYAHIKSIEEGKTLGDRNATVIKYVLSVLDPQEGDEFYIMDPHLKILESLREPFIDGELEKTIWSHLISYLALRNSNFRIITSEPIKLEGDSPFRILYPDPTIDVTIEASYYPQAQIYNAYKLHDRYLLLKRSDNLYGIHFGPSLTDIKNKDVTITLFSHEDASEVYQNFKRLWDLIKLSKGWKLN